MNVYDFDKTIFKKDSTIAFYFFEIKRHPSLIRYIFVQCFYFFLYLFGFADKKRFKEGFFSFLKGIKNIDKEIEFFWIKNKHSICSWYLKNMKNDDVVISASPTFIVASICNEMGITEILASNVDKKTGKFAGENCYGQVKLKRFQDKFKDSEIEKFYSDSLSDEPLAKISKEAFIVKKEKIIPWAEYKPSTLSKIKKMFISPEFLGFLIIGGINALNGVLFSYLFSLKYEVNLAFVFGYLCSIPISYLLNSFFVFKRKLGFIRFIKFIISYIPNFLIQFGLVYLLNNVLGLHKILVYIIAVLLAIPITFIMLKLFAFATTKMKTKKVYKDKQ